MKTINPNVNKLLEIFKINEEKHACKCYMEGLSSSEQKVANLLAHQLDYKDYFLFNNLIIKSKNNNSTQIDHIIVSKYGIFVIENKDLSGTILGSEDRSNWSQLLPSGNKYLFQNPIRQNYGHVMALKDLMRYAKYHFVNIVVFTGKAKLITEPIENVVYYNQLISCIKKYKEVKLSQNEVEFTVGKLSYACQTITISQAEHVANVNKNKNHQSLNEFNRKPFGYYTNPTKFTKDNNPAKTSYLLK